MSDRKHKSPFVESLRTLSKLRRRYQRWVRATWTSLGAFAFLAAAAPFVWSPGLGAAAVLAGVSVFFCRSRVHAVLLEGDRVYRQAGFTPKVKDQPETASALPGQLENPEPAGAPDTAPITTTVELRERRSWPAADGGQLVLGPGRVEVRFRLGFHPQRDPHESMARDFPVVETWATDSEGAWWSTRTLLDPRALTGPLTPDGPSDGKDEIRFWIDAPPAWREALQDRCLLSGARDLLDSRERFQLPVGKDEVTLMLKYQGPRLDVAWLEDDGKLLVRAAEMYYEVGEGDDRADVADRVCFGYRIDPATILPITAPRRHWTEWEEWEQSEQPRPPTFVPA